jgi:6-methylsalicylic acid synthase
VHAAGVLDNRMAADVDDESLARVMRPKVAGALVLHELFPSGSLDFFALFSSAGPLLGLPGQTSYAAANAVLDALATHRGADTISLGWTSWRGLGMSTSSAAIDAELAARGTGDITAAEAFGSWEYAARHDRPHVAVLRTIPKVPGMRRPALLAELSTEDTPAPASSGAPWAGLRDGELRDFLVGEVTAQVAGELKLATDELDVRRPLIETGLDSVMTQIVRNRLERLFRVSLPATLLWNRPTVLAIGEFLAELLAPGQADVESTDGPPENPLPPAVAA